MAGHANSLPLTGGRRHRRGFAPADPARPFSVHTGWIGSSWPSASPGD